MTTPLFISFEGGEGVGKSTQAVVLRDGLWGEGVKTSLVREPGSTPLGWHLREYLKSKQPLTKEAELLLFVAARAELVVTEIQPSLKAGITVIADRYEATSVAYQGYGRKIDLEVVRYLNRFATNGLEPNLTFLIDLDPAAAMRRIGKPQLTMALEPDDSSESGIVKIEAQRRFEDQPVSFHKRVRQGFLTMARENPNRWVIIDGSRPEESISEEIRCHVMTWMGIPLRRKCK